MVAVETATEIDFVCDHNPGHNLERSFENYSDYNFDDPTKKFESEELTIFDGILNTEGKATVNTNFKVSDNAPGLLQATFKIRAFETGGDFSTDIFTMPFSSYSSYVGCRIPEGPGWNGAVYSNESVLIPIVTLNENGKPVGRGIYLYRLPAKDNIITRKMVLVK